MDLGLRDRVCLITGSTGGIGLATARILAAEGAKVVVSVRDSGRVERAREEAGAALGIGADMVAPGPPEALIGEASVTLGGDDFRANNVVIAYRIAFDVLTCAQ